MGRETEAVCYPEPADQAANVSYTEVIDFITRYLELSAAFETIEAVIAELDYHQSAMKGNGGVTLPQSAYV